MLLNISMRWLEEVAVWMGSKIGWAPTFWRAAVRLSMVDFVVVDFVGGPGILLR